MRFGLERRLGVGILCVSGAIALLYFILMSALFSNTYDMLSAALAAKGKAEAGALAARLPFALATNDQAEIGKILADFHRQDAQGRSTVILDKKLKELESSGPHAEAWTGFRDQIRAIEHATSWTNERFVISAAPSKNEEDLSGYVVTLTSLETFLSVRSRLRLYAIATFLIGIVVIGLGANSLVKRLIVRPILSTAARLRDIAEGDGDLTQRLSAATNDEIGELANQFNGFAAKLQGIIRGIAEQAQPLAAEAQALTQASSTLQNSVNRTISRATSVERAAQTMSANTANVSSAVGTAMGGLGAIASAVEEMTSSIDEIATHSEQASNVTQDVVVQAKEIDGFMAELDRSAQAIDKVTETITSISAQTNLLALNATIEAARAGAAGKGFAVVANEIKELASQTASATEDVKERIRGIQASTQSALSGNARIATVITDINELVQSIAQSINQQATVAKTIASDIASANLGVAQANGLVSDSADAAHSIARDVAEVTGAANEIREVSEGLHQNSDRLATLSNGLGDLVRTFRT